MEYRYLGIREDGKTIYIRNKRFPNDQYAFKTMEGAIYPCMLYDAVVLSDDIVSIGGMNHYISTLKAVRMDDVDTLSEENDNQLMVKNINHKLPNPYKLKLQPFTSAVVMACLKCDKNIALTKEEHANKLTIIRQVRGMVDTDNELSTKKADELLRYHGLSFVDILKDELVVNKG